MLKIFEPLDFSDAKPRRPQQTYIVRPGDTLAGIALRHGMKEAEIRAMNNIWGGNVYAGQEIYVHRKRRSQSMPQLLLASDLDKEAVARGGELARRDNPAEEEEEGRDQPRWSTDKGGIGNQRKLSVIYEHQQKETREDNQRTVEPPLLTPVAVASSNHPPRLKFRSLSERLPTQQETDEDVYGLPRLIGSGADEILSDARDGPSLVPKIQACLPMRLRGHDWKLLYNSSTHGSSLHTLMRKLRGCGATLVVVETCDGDVFGGFAPVPWSTSISYYGTGEAFVFAGLPKFEVFTWKRANSMIMFSNDQAMAMGGGGGFAWYLNADLSRGTSAPSETFANRCLASQADFDVLSVEVWTFVL